MLKIFDREDNNILWGNLGSDLMLYPSVAETWTRKIVLNGGFFDGVLKLQGDFDLEEIFKTMLGYGIKETQPSGTTFEGFIYEMVLNDNVERTLSYRDLFNSVAAQSGNYINNGGFETGDFTNWTNSFVTDITIETTNVARGENSVKMTRAGASAQLTQSFDCIENTSYRLSFYSMELLSTIEARYKITDNIGNITGVIEVLTLDGNYKKQQLDFITNTGATTCTIRLFNGLAAGTEDLFYDEVRVERIVNGRVVSAVTAFTENDESITRYGKKQRVLSRFPELQDAETGRDNYLALSAYPTIQRGNISFIEEKSIDIFVRGYFETLKWNSWTLQTGGTKVSVQTILEHIRDNNEFINTVLVEGSPSDVFVPDPFLVSQNDAVRSMIQQLGDGWHIKMGINRQLIVEPFSYSPKYFMRGGLLYDDPFKAQTDTQTISPFEIVPATVRDLDSVLSGLEPFSVYEDRRDFIMSNVEVSAENIAYGSTNVENIPYSG